MGHIKIPPIKQLQHFCSKVLTGNTTEFLVIIEHRGKELLSSYRAELGVIVGIITVIKSLIKFHNIKLGKTKIGLEIFV